VQTQVDAWVELHNTGDGPVGPVPIVILHSMGGSTAADIPAPVDTAIVDPLVATQRRRLGR
jgi:hypothetical protein